MEVRVVVVVVVVFPDVGVVLHQQRFLQREVVTSAVVLHAASVVTRPEGRRERG